MLIFAVKTILFFPERAKLLAANLVCQGRRPFLPARPPELEGSRSPPGPCLLTRPQDPHRAGPPLPRTLGSRHSPGQAVSSSDPGTRSGPGATSPQTPGPQARDPHRAGPPLSRTPGPGPSPGRCLLTRPREPPGRVPVSCPGALDPHWLVPSRAGRRPRVWSIRAGRGSRLQAPVRQERGVGASLGKEGRSPGDAARQGPAAGPEDEGQVHVHHIFCHPLHLLSSVFPSIRVFCELALHIR